MLIMDNSITDSNHLEKDVEDVDIVPLMNLVPEVLLTIESQEPTEESPEQNNYAGSSKQLHSQAKLKYNETLSEEEDKPRVGIEVKQESCEPQHYKCPLCDHISTHPGNLKLHVRRRHSEKKPHSCPFCEYTSKVASDMKRHMHSKHNCGEKHACPYCEYTCSRSDAMRRHVMAKHTNERPHSCPYCHYTCTQAGDLKQHVLSKHTDKEPYACAYCQFTCSKSDERKRHILTEHTDERPYKCHLCPYWSTQAGNVKYHLLAKHKLDQRTQSPGADSNTHLQVNQECTPANSKISVKNEHIGRQSVAVGVSEKDFSTNIQSDTDFSSIIKSEENHNKTNSISHLEQFKQ